MSPVAECQVCGLGTTSEDQLCHNCRQLLTANRRHDRRENEGARTGVRPRHTRKRR